MNLITKIETRSLQFLQRRILKIIEKHQLWLSENPTALQWIICHWENIFYAGRICYGYEGIIKNGACCEDNPKYELDRIKYINDDIDSIVYSAFVNAINTLTSMYPDKKSERNYGSFTLEDFKEIKERYEKTLDNPYYLLARKPDKTMEEWVEVLTDNRYRYSNVYTSREHVYRELLASHGNNYYWNKNGYMVESGEQYIFEGWQMLDVTHFPLEIQPALEQIITAPKVQDAIKAVKAHQTKAYAKEDKERMNMEMLLLRTEKSEEEITQMSVAEIKEAHHRILKAFRDKMQGQRKEEVFVYNSLYDDYSPMMKIPFNAHESYVNASYEIVQHVLAYSKEHGKDAVKAVKKWSSQKSLRNFKINQITKP